MATSEVMLNPYAPVLLADSPHTLQPVVIANRSLPLDVFVQPGLLFRELRLYGFINAEIAWDARHSVEQVCVNGQRAASKLSLWFVPHFDFELTTSIGTLPAAIDVEVSWLLFVRAFRLTIDGTVVYGEGRYRGLEPAQE